MIELIGSFLSLIGFIILKKSPPRNQKKLKQFSKQLKGKIDQEALELKEQNEELEEAKSYVNNLVKSMSDILIVVDPNAKIKVINKAAYNLLGYRKNELIGKPVNSIFAEPEQITWLRKGRRKKIIKNSHVSSREMYFMSKSGEKIPVSFSDSIMRNRKGELVGIIGIARDMREIKKFMRKEKELKDMLIQAEKLNAIGQLASGVAHEVRNPLGIIIQGVNYLEKKISPKKKDIFETLSVVKKGVKRADKIVDSLLDFSKSTNLNLHPQNINSILKKSLILIKSEIKSKNIKIVRKINENIPKVLVDKNKIEQVFVNIFLNAIQAMPEGGKITVRSYGKKLKKFKNGIGKRKVDYFKIGEKAVIIEIGDAGIGISKKDLKKVFAPFFTTKGASRGVGLGLSVCRNIITMHRALIDIKSQQGKGTKVILTLKISPK